jgi:hypothetical protein
MRGTSTAIDTAGYLVDRQRTWFDALLFLVELTADPDISPLDAYFGLKDELEILFSRPVDLVSVGSVRNPYVKASIDLDRQLVYAE